MKSAWLIVAAFVFFACKKSADIQECNSTTGIVASNNTTPKDSIYWLGLDTYRPVGKISDTSKNPIDFVMWSTDVNRDKLFAVYNSSHIGLYGFTYEGDTIPLIDLKAAIDNTYSGYCFYSVNKSLIGRIGFRLREGNATLKTFYIGTDAKVFTSSLIGLELCAAFGQCLNERMKSLGKFDYKDFDF